MLHRRLDVRVKPPARHALEMAPETHPVELADVLVLPGIQNGEIRIDQALFLTEHVLEVAQELPELRCMRGRRFPGPERLVALSLQNHRVFAFLDPVHALDTELGIKLLKRRARSLLHEVGGADRIIEAAPGFAARVSPETRGLLEKDGPVLPEEVS